MMLIIELRPADSLGLGGDIMRQLGARQAGGEGNIWTMNIATDPALYDDYTQLMPITDRLLSSGIKPMRVSTRTGGGQATPVSASAAEMTKFNEGLADGLRKLVLQASADELSAEDVGDVLAVAKIVERGQY